MKSILVFLLVTLASLLARATTWHVGPTRQYTAPSKVMALVASGDTIAIDAGTYSGDVGTWTKDDLFIYCPNGTAHLAANGASAQGKGIWVIDGNNTTLENIEFSGASVADHNGAGIRQEGAGLVCRRCYFHDNEDGILTNQNSACDILLVACEFARNGYGDGYSHNMYIGHIRSLTLKYCYVHEAKVGHEVKSRAGANYILYNVIADSATGTASYNIDLPNGGLAIILGNSIMKSARAQNTVLVNYGEEGLINTDTELYVVNNTMLTDRANTTFIRIAAGAPTALVQNNIFAGGGVVVSATADTISNFVEPATGLIRFLDTTRFAYSIVTPASGMRAGTPPGKTLGGFELRPISQYSPVLDSTPRSDNPPFVGAYAYTSLGVLTGPFPSAAGVPYPNPCTLETLIPLSNEITGEVTIDLCDERGALILHEQYAVNAAHEIRYVPRARSGHYRYTVRNASGMVLSAGPLVIE